MGGIMLALPRWARDPYYKRVLQGRVLDCGGAGDPFVAVAGRFPGVTEVVTADCTGTNLGPSVTCDLNDWTPEPASFDVVLSSHTLEHLHQPFTVCDRWWAAVKPGGYLLLILPDWRTYEREVWPSSRNPDHKTAWRLMGEPTPDLPLFNLLTMAPGAALHRATTLDADFDPHDPNDQTGTGLCECGLEAVWWKRP